MCQARQVLLICLGGGGDVAFRKRLDRALSLLPGPELGALPLPQLVSLGSMSSRSIYIVEAFRPTELAAWRPFTPTAGRTANQISGEPVLNGDWLMPRTGAPGYDLASFASEHRQMLV